VDLGKIMLICWNLITIWIFILFQLHNSNFGLKRTGTMY
jgi:hypothetical protein